VTSKNTKKWGFTNGLLLGNMTSDDSVFFVSESKIIHSFYLFIFEMILFLPH